MIAVLINMLKFANLLTVRNTISTNDQLKTLKTTYRWKCLDGYVFDIIKSDCIFYFCVLIWSLLGYKKSLGHPQIGLL